MWRRNGIIFYCLTIKIRPLWDWNKVITISGTGASKIKIRPLWDWNVPLWRIQEIDDLIKIRPLWDWNTISVGMKWKPLTN